MTGWLEIGLVVLLTVILSVYLFSTLISHIIGAPNISTPIPVARKALSLLDLSPDDRLVDLGCGVGRVVKLARKNYHTDSTGIEAAIAPYLIAKLSGVKVKLSGIFQADLSEYNKFYIYLSPRSMTYLEPIAEKWLQRKAKIVSVDFAFRNIKPRKTVAVGRYRLYLYA